MKDCKKLTLIDFLHRFLWFLSCGLNRSVILTKEIYKGNVNFRSLAELVISTVWIFELFRRQSVSLTVAFHIRNKYCCYASVPRNNKHSVGHCKELALDRLTWQDVKITSTVPRRNSLLKRLATIYTRVLILRFLASVTGGYGRQRVRNWVAFEAGFRLSAVVWDSPLVCLRAVFLILTLEANLEYSTGSRAVLKERDQGKRAISARRSKESLWGISADCLLFCRAIASVCPVSFFRFINTQSMHDNLGRFIEYNRFWSMIFHRCSRNFAITSF